MPIDKSGDTAILLMECPVDGFLRPRPLTAAVEKESIEPSLGTSVKMAPGGHLPHGDPLPNPAGAPPDRGSVGLRPGIPQVIG